MNFKSPFISKGLALFAATQFLGIYFARRILADLGPLPVRDGSFFSPADFIYLAVFIFIFLFLSVKFQKFGAILYRLFLTLIVFSMVQLVLSLRLDSGSAFLGAAAITTGFWLYSRVIIQNLIMIVSMAALGGLFGLSLTPMTAVWILVIFSFYDIIAVYKTGHMVKMAETMIRSRAIFGFLIPRTLADFGQSAKEAKVGGQFMVLGSGDVVLPLVLSSSLIRISLTQSVMVTVFSIFGFLLTGLIFTSQNIRRPMAALPPIAMSAIIGYLLVSAILR